jgi:hypothetical protein
LGLLALAGHLMNLPLLSRHWLAANDGAEPARRLIAESASTSFFILSSLVRGWPEATEGRQYSRCPECYNWDTHQAPCSSLRRCYVLIEDCRRKILAANSNDPPFMLAANKEESEDELIG